MCQGVPLSLLSEFEERVLEDLVVGEEICSSAAEPAEFFSSSLSLSLSSFSIRSLRIG